MDRRSLPALLVFAGACATPSSPEDVEALARANNLSHLYQGWDDELAAKVFLGPASAREARHRELLWLASQLGECSPPARIPRRLAGSDGRFEYTCEHGAMEFEVWLEGGAVKDASLGGRGIDTPAPLLAAAQEVVAAMPMTESTCKRLKVSESFASEAVRALGHCTITGLDIASHVSGIWELECDDSAQRIKVRVDMNGAITQALLVPALEDAPS